LFLAVQRLAVQTIKFPNHWIITFPKNSIPKQAPLVWITITAGPTKSPPRARRLINPEWGVTVKQSSRSFASNLSNVAETSQEVSIWLTNAYGNLLRGNACG